MVRNADSRALVSYDPAEARDEGSLIFLKRMVEVTFEERERAEAELEKAKQIAKMAKQTHANAMAKYTNAKLRFEKRRNSM